MQAKFTQGSIFRHIVVMTLSSMIGMLALFSVDLADMYFLSLLGEIEIVAALGYAGSVLFFTLSLCIGLSIGCGALVSQAVGTGDQDELKRRIAHIFILIFLITTLSTFLLFAGIEPLLAWLGATDETMRLAVLYLRIVLASMPVMGLAMACGGILRALGDARASMVLSLVGAAVNALLDPVLIFVMDLGVAGAAFATVAARFAMLAFGLYAIVVRRRLMGKFNARAWVPDMRAYAAIAVPATLTNLSTPIAVAYTTAVLASFGDAAVGGNAIVSRIQMVAFAGLFSLSGSVGPIAGQNLGAHQFDRISATLNNSLLFIAGYCAIAFVALLVLTEWLIGAFQAQGEAADIIRWFCLGFNLIFLFNGTTFMTNALFNNLRVAHYATFFNFGKATLGTIPFVYLGAKFAGPYGVYWGLGLGSAVVAVLGVVVARRHIARLAATGLATERTMTAMV